jgi:hypothetical protein
MVFEKKNTQMKGDKEMRWKTILALALAVAGMTVLFAPSALAADEWYTCTIVRIGGNSTSATAPMYVLLKDSGGKFTKNFRIQENRLNQIMAVLLTAASNGSKVRIYGDHTIAADANRVLKAAYYIP